jgi:hypothetical protein
MSVFRNSPQVKNESGETTIKRYVHQKLHGDHNSVHWQITEGGKVILSKVVGKDEKTGDIEYDEIEIPASLVFKLANMLKNTREIVFVPVSQLASVKDKTSAVDE